MATDSRIGVVSRFRPFGELRTTKRPLFYTWGECWRSQNPWNASPERGEGGESPCKILPNVEDDYCGKGRLDRRPNNKGNKRRKCASVWEVSGTINGRGGFTPSFSPGLGLLRLGLFAFGTRDERGCVRWLEAFKRTKQTCLWICWRNSCSDVVFIISLWPTFTEGFWRGFKVPDTGQVCVNNYTTAVFI